ncbi:hypothetical protein SAMN05444344_1772 [Tenacibaculum mesophilum]|nr:hypothetical protein SAMN05444344_1772 [Tenacibaculum mesophilum]
MYFNKKRSLFGVFFFKQIPSSKHLYINLKKMRYNDSYSH